MGMGMDKYVLFYFLNNDSHSIISDTRYDYNFLTHPPLSLYALLKDDNQTIIPRYYRLRAITLMLNSHES